MAILHLPTTPILVMGMNMVATARLRPIPHMARVGFPIMFMASVMASVTPMAVLEAVVLPVPRV